MIYCKSFRAFDLWWCLVCLDLTVMPVDCCPVNTTEFHGKCYELVDDRLMTYTEVLLFCSKRHNGIPAVVNSLEISTFITSFVQSSDKSLFIGLTDLANEGIFVWSDGTPLDWEAWSPGGNQPNGGLNQNCVKLEQPDSWRWHDYACAYGDGCICQYTDIDGAWTDWDEVSSCSTTCGLGQGARYRHCRNPVPMNGGSFCVGPNVEVVDCIVANCPVNGGWNDWGDWSACSVSCGDGVRMRERNCTNPRPEFGGFNCSGNSTELKDCSTQNCQVNGGWNDWGDWGACSASCGGGSHMRERNCTNPSPEFGGLNCTGNYTEMMDCSTQTCWEYFDDWGAWSACSASCGQGYSSRHRNCTDGYWYGFLSCSNILRFEEKNCLLSNCSENEAAWNNWGDWGACSVSCGYGARIRERNCTNLSPDGEGLNCTGNVTETVDCSLQSCPENEAAWNNWGDWGACSVSCGYGARIRERNCTNLSPDGEGLNCTGNVTETVDCSLQSCPVDGAWSDWGGWSACSVSCGDTVRMRGRNCSNPSPDSNGLYCIGNSREKANCSLQNCPVNNTWSNWSAWSACSESCHQGERMRVRNCLNLTTMLNDTDKGCVGTSTETKTCFGSNCPGVGLWSHWGLWSPCSASCGVGRTTRTRCCLPGTSWAPGENGTCPGSCCDQKGCSAIIRCPDFVAEISEHLITATPRKITTALGETRPSAKHIGVFATAILVSVFGALIILDLRTLYLHFRGKPTEGSVSVEDK